MRGTPRKDYTGMRVGSLVAVRDVGANHGRLWLFKCDCGGEWIARSAIFTGPTNKNAGCEKCYLQRVGTHGQTNGKLYSCWRDMKSRCFLPSNKSRKYYYDKGIKVCAEWLSFDAFMAWALASGYKDGLTIERVNPNWHYDPSNCEWVTKSVNNSRAKHPGHYWRSMTCDA